MCGRKHRFQKTFVSLQCFRLGFSRAGGDCSGSKLQRLQPQSGAPAKSPALTLRNKVEL